MRSFVTPTWLRSVAVAALVGLLVAPSGAHAVLQQKLCMLAGVLQGPGGVVNPNLATCFTTAAAAFTAAVPAGSPTAQFVSFNACPVPTAPRSAEACSYNWLHTSLNSTQAYNGSLAAEFRMVEVNECEAQAGQPINGGFGTVSIPGCLGTAPPTSTCKTGCLANVTPGSPYVFGSNGTGTSYWTAQAKDYTYTGAECTGGGGSTPICPGSGGTGGETGSGGTGPTPEPLPAPLPPGMCPGTINGVSVQVPCTQTGTGSGTSGPGSGTAPAPGPIASAPPGTPEGTTTQQGTSCIGSTCTTTTTTTTTGGGFGSGNQSTSTTTETKDKGTFCKDNPGDAQCEGGSSSFSGSCAAVECKGDAIQCAIARDQLLRNCQAWGEAGAGDAAVIAAGGGDTPTGHPRNTGTTTDVSTLVDETDLLGGGGCPADISVAMGSMAPVVLAVSKICAPASMLGDVLLALSALAWVGIVFVRGK